MKPEQEIPASVEHQWELIDKCVRDYHFALDHGESGAMANRKLAQQVQLILGVEYVPGQEKERRISAYFGGFERSAL